jgi:hypothetical protein
MGSAMYAACLEVQAERMRMLTSEENGRMISRFPSRVLACCRLSFFFFFLSFLWARVAGQRTWNAEITRRRQALVRKREADVGETSDWRRRAQLRVETVVRWSCSQLLGYFLPRHFRYFSLLGVNGSLAAIELTERTRQVGVGAGTHQQ